MTSYILETHLFVRQLILKNQRLNNSATKNRNLKMDSSVYSMLLLIPMVIRTAFLMGILVLEHYLDRLRVLLEQNW